MGKGILHCVFKPENIFVTKDGQRVKILDFRLAKLKAPVAADVRRLTSRSAEGSEPPHVGCYEEGQGTTIRIDADATKRIEGNTTYALPRSHWHRLTHGRSCQRRRSGRRRVACSAQSGRA